MNTKIYMRVAAHPDGRDADYKVAASVRPNYSPLTVDTGYNERDLPTVAFAVELEIPEAMIFQAEQTLAEIQIPEEAVEIVAAVSYPGEDDGDSS